jgi:hypothetical protein
MPGLDDVVLPAARTGPEPSPPSRRSVLRGAAGAGAAGIAAAAFMGGALPAAAGTTAAGASRGAGTAAAGEPGPVVVHVRDAATGEMDVFRGTTHTRVHDKELAARLVGASS